MDGSNQRRVWRRGSITPESPRTFFAEVTELDNEYRGDQAYDEIVAEVRRERVVLEE